MVEHEAATKTRQKHALKHPPASVARIGRLAVAASAVHHHEVFKHLRLCETALERMLKDAGIELPAEVNPMTDDLADLMRAADETIVEKAMHNACVPLPITNATELLEVFDCILDVRGVPDADGDVYEPEAE